MTNDVENDIHLNVSNFIAVPSWRMRPMHTLYIMEGTENLDDHVFEKRHQKPENDERRRKRWDLQRLRELGLIKKNSHKQDHEIADNDDIRGFELKKFEKDLQSNVGKIEKLSRKLTNAEHAMIIAFLSLNPIVHSCVNQIHGGNFSYYRVFSVHQ
ncbi:hypothetical protein HELRODRAFT_161340 [Helobdella robusta]|uniref:PEHE domain-containing protein n=1 Tax=Helobdella robusta TaxID=6412 RepID=T1ERD0_HELRO|nr:hypothetical protein HELRODRAFT_161340 [Helobdella robusta]ESO02105.1 hypothetical protein HELRODRAFT_161340 [Helobdella robusta]